MRVLATRCIVLTGLLTAALHANPANAQNGGPYLVAGPVFTNGFPSLAVDATIGVERRDGPAGVGVEGGFTYLLPERRVSAHGASESDGALVSDFSVYTAYHFKRIGAVEPFVKGGLVALTDFSQVIWWGLEGQGGADLQLGRRVALRTAVRGGYSWIPLGFEAAVVIR